MGYDKTHGTKKESQSQLDVESGEETRMENDSMATAKVHSGGSSKGNFGKPHKFYDKAAARYEVTKKKVKKVNEIGDRTRKDTYAYRKPEAKVLKN